MPEGYTLELMHSEAAPEKFTPEQPRVLFHVAVGKLCPFNQARNAQRPGKLAYEDFVSLGLAPSQPVIHVKNLEGDAKLRRKPMQDMQKDHRIGPARYRHTDFVSGGQHVITRDDSGYPSG